MALTEHALAFCDVRFRRDSVAKVGVKNSEGRRRDFRVEIRGTSSLHAKLIGDFGNATEVIRIADRLAF